MYTSSSAALFALGISLSAGSKHTKNHAHTHAETHAQAQVCTQRAALSQQFIGNEALHRGQSLQMHICSEP